MEKDGYKELVRFAKVYDEEIQELNRKAFNLVNSDGFVQSWKKIQEALDISTSGLNNAVKSFADSIERIMPDVDLVTRGCARSLQLLSEKYKELIGIYDYTELTESMIRALEESQLFSILQLSSSFKTKMIDDAITCFTNAKYEYLPSVINQAMERPIIGAADIAFLKNGAIIPTIESELRYPNGLKTSLKTLNKTTASDIANTGEIEYNTATNHFISSDAEEDAKGLNIICAGRTIFDSEGDMFTEHELMDFVTYLSQTPMTAMIEDTGKKIFNWIRELYEQHCNLIDFDRDIYYHCRARNKDAMPYTYEEMLRAPHGVVDAGRFNQTGRSHYYYASTQWGAESEIKKHLKKEQVLQTVILKPIRPIKILDLSGTLKRGASFLRMIRYQLDDYNKMPRQYLLPCFVADCCQNIGFEGIKYYGSKEYDNYVSWSDDYFAYAGMCSKEC